MDKSRLCITSCKNKAGRGICMTSKPKNINQLWSDKQVGITPAQFLHEDRCKQFKGMKL